LLWDPTRDVDELIREFCSGYYGPAADELLAYVNLLENSVRGNPPIQADEFDKKFTWMTPDLVSQARDLFDRALAETADNETYHRRVKEAEVSLEAWLLWKPGELKEDRERLIRADLGGDTFARARSLIEHCRGASPREWGNGPKYHMNFLTMHGGPLAVLKAGPVTVKVAPVQNGQIREVRWGDKIAIDRCHVTSTLDSVYYDVLSRKKTRVEMAADLGVAMWGGRNQKQTGYRTIELSDDGEILCGGSFERIGRSFGTNQATFVTTYRINKFPNDIRIEYGPSNDRLQPVPLNADMSAFTMSPVSFLRVSRTDRGVVIEDSYRALVDQPRGRVKYDAKSRTVTVSITMPETQLVAKGRTSYGERVICLRKLPN